MTQRSIPLAHAAVAGGVVFSEPDNALWLGTELGEIVTVRLLDGRTTVLGGAYVQPIAALPLPDGLGVLVVERAGRLRIAPRADAGAAHSVEVTDLGRPLAAARLHADDGFALALEAGPAAQLLRIDLRTGAADTVAMDLQDPISLAVDAANRQALVIEQTAAGPALATIDLDTGVVDRTAAGLDAGAAHLVAAPAAFGMAAIVASGPAGDLALVDLAGQPPVPGSSAGAAVLGLARWGALILAVTDAAVVAVEWGLDEAGLSIAVPLGPVFTGGYFQAEFDPTLAGLAPGDVELVVEDGPPAGAVSAGKAALGPAGQRRVRVLAGPIPGEYLLSAVRTADGSRLGSARFRVTSHWPDDEVGPPIAVTGERQVFMKGGWGGGPAGPQNVRVHPAPDQWRVAVVLVSTRDRRFPANIAGEQAKWQDIAVGPGTSAKTYYEEVSYQRTPGVPGGPTGTAITLSGNQVLGPVDLPNAWADYFEGGGIADVWGGWSPKGTAWQEIATAISEWMTDHGLGDTVLRNSDALVVVMRTASADAVTVGTMQVRAQYVWPQAAGADIWWKTQFAYGRKPIPMLFMPDDFPANMPAASRWPLAPALCHELGHTLGCEDLYSYGDLPAEVMVREIQRLDLMDIEVPLPHFSLPNRMRLGWIDPGWIQVFDFGANPNGGAVTLQAAETLSRSGPPAGRKAGIEIRVRDGWNYYFEYRRTQAGQVGDQRLNSVSPAGRMVVGTDVIADGVGEVNRPRILLLPVDADGDGPILNRARQDYEESDVTDPQRMHDFRLVYDHTEPGDANAAQVHVEYVGANRAELQIRPAPGRGRWKSPDIDVEGPGGNRLQKGLRHTIVVWVKNAGTFDADNVRIGVRWLPFTTVPGAWNNLPDPPRQNIPAGATAAFRVDWDVPASFKIDDVEVEHFCVRADIDRYVDPRDPNHDEIVVSNNWAQSNFDSTNVPFGSPSERANTGLTITNRLGQATRFLTVVEQTSPWFRAYLGNAWLHLQPGETRMVEIAYESLAGDPDLGADFAMRFEEIAHGDPNQLSFTTLVVPPERKRCISPRIEWGAGLSVRAGFHTHFRDVEMPGEIVRGQLEGTVNGQAQPPSFGQVNVVLWLAHRPEEQFLATGQVDAAGRFTAVVPREIMDVFGQTEIVGEALYLGTPMWSPCRSGVRRLA